MLHRNLFIILTIVTILTTCSFIRVSLAAEEFPSFPMSFWGKVYINDSLAPKGTIIKAYYQNALSGEVTVQDNGIYGYPESIKQKLIVGEGTGVITFTFQTPAYDNGKETSGNALQSYSNFESGSSVHQDFYFIVPVQTTTTTTTTPPASGGYTPPTSTTTTKPPSKIDTNQDGKIDIFDFNSLMINWGKKEENNIADFDGNGQVDIFDFNLLMINWT